MLVESTLFKMPHCWKSHAAAQLCKAPTDALTTSVKFQNNLPDCNLRKDCAG